MADSYDAGLLPRTYFRAPRVPFDFRAGMIAVKNPDEEFLDRMRAIARVVGDGGEDESSTS